MEYFWTPCRYTFEFAFDTYVTISEQFQAPEQRQQAQAAAATERVQVSRTRQE